MASFSNTFYPQLSTKQAWRTQFEELLRSLQNPSCTIERLVLTGTQIKDKRVKKLALALKANHSVTSLDLSERALASEDELSVLVEALKSSRCLTALDITKNERDFGSRAFKLIEELVKDCFSLVIFNCDRGSNRVLRSKEIQSSLRNIDAYLDENNMLLAATKKESAHLAMSFRGFLLEDLEVQIHSLPNCRTLTLEHMKSLDLSNNTIRELRDSIVSLRFDSLTHLRLANNNLSTLPAVLMKSLPSLEVLDLKRNNFEYLPQEINMLRNLKDLDVSENRLLDLPGSLAHLHLIQSIDISDNKLESIPEYFGVLQDLVLLRYDKNPLKSSRIPKEILARGPESLLSFLRSRAGECSTVYRMKLMLVGQGNVGKTSLVRALQNPNLTQANTVKKSSSLKPIPNNATDGISVSTWNVKTSKENTISFSIWDFAGQDVYYTTHSFFLSHRALYLVVMDITQPLEASRVEYWLKSVEARTKDAPVILVATHADEEQCTDTYVSNVLRKLENEFRNFHCPRFPNIVVSMAVSTVNGLGMKKLKDKILEVASRQPYMPEEIPRSYIIFEERLQQIRLTKFPPVLTWRQTLALAAETSIAERDVKTVCLFLNDCGSISFFPSVNQDHVVLEPQWIIDIFATIVTMKANFVKDGILSYTDIPQIWREPKYPTSLHPFLISLLETFELAYTLSARPGSNSVTPDVDPAAFYSSDKKMFVPSLLPDSLSKSDARLNQVFPPKMSSWKQQQFSRHFRFGFLPIGFFTRLIVRLLQAYDWNPCLYWKNGILLEKNENHVLMELNAATNLLKITARGWNPAPQFSHIVESLSTLIAEWTNVPVEVFVPCTHCLKADNGYLNLMNFEHLEQAVAQGKVTINCGDTDIVELRDLVPDVTMSHINSESIEYEELHIDKEVGRGAFAKVFLGKWRGQQIAIKELIQNSEKQLDKEYMDVFAEFRREAAIMSSFAHPNLVAIKAVVMNPFCMILEFMGEGDLFGYIHFSDPEPKPLDLPLVISLALDVANAMNYLHSNDFIHRDLKSPNVLLGKSNDPKTPIIAKVADFGLSRNLLFTPELQKRLVDNPTWLAPEILRNQPYTQASDIYAMGIILFELLTRTMYFGNITFMFAIEEMVMKGDRPQIPDRIPSALSALVQECWSGNPESRPPFSNIVRRLQEFDISAVSSTCNTSTLSRPSPRPSAQPKSPRAGASSSLPRPGGKNTKAVGTGSLRDSTNTTISRRGLSDSPSLTFSDSESDLGSFSSPSPRSMSPRPSPAASPVSPRSSVDSPSPSPSALSRPLSSAARSADSSPANSPSLRPGPNRPGPAVRTTVGRSTLRNNLNDHLARSVGMGLGVGLGKQARKADSVKIMNDLDKWCPYTEFGCPGIMEDDNFDSHMDKTAKEHVRMLYKGILERDAKISKLNAILREHSIEVTDH